MPRVGGVLANLFLERRAARRKAVRRDLVREQLEVVVRPLENHVAEAVVEVLVGVHDGYHVTRTQASYLLDDPDRFELGRVRVDYHQATFAADDPDVDVEELVARDPAPIGHLDETLLLVDPAPCRHGPQGTTCLLYTSDAADDLLCVDLGGRRIIK